MNTQHSPLSDLNTPLDRKISTEGRTAVQAIEAAAPELTAKVRHMVDVGKTRVEEWRGGLQGGIREDPIRSVLIAAGIGAVLGLILGRRSR